MRIYLLIVIKNNVCDWYIYNNGFMYYTPKHFIKGSMDKDVNITTGFIDRHVYDENPLTIQEMYKHIGREHAQILQGNIEKCFSKVCTRYKADFIKLNKDTPGIKFCIYGIDIAPDDKLDVLLIECNKGPSLDYKDKKDGALKYGMVRDAFAMVGIIPWGKGNASPKNFIEIV